MTSWPPTRSILGRRRVRHTQPATSGRRRSKPASTGIARWQKTPSTISAKRESKRPCSICAGTPARPPPPSKIMLEDCAKQACNTSRRGHCPAVENMHPKKRLTSLSRGSVAFVALSRSERPELKPRPDVRGHGRALADGLKSRAPPFVLHPPHPPRQLLQFGLQIGSHHGVPVA